VSSKADFADRFGDIIRGLLSLEINTILKEGMQATRMGSPREALDDIAQGYASWLREHGAQIAPPGGALAADYFQYTLAIEAGKLPPDLPGGGSAIAVRIQRNSLALAAMFNKLVASDPDPGPDPDELVQLRKIWEIGTEQIVMQTVLWIDGDATQRIHPGYIDKSHEQLLGLHAASVAAALGYWKSIGDLVLSFFRSAWHQLRAG
jgi:hypothetical protein